VAVGFYHLGNRNRVGAERLLSRALQRLEGYPDQYGGLDLGALKAAVHQWRHDLRTGVLPEGGPGRVPPRLQATPERGG
jgi:predicted metal-dependent hydrolase